MASIAHRLQHLKQLMHTRQLAFYVVPSQDAHGSEYISAADTRREFISGFTGSAGTAIVSATDPQSFLFTDGRYFNQAHLQLDPAFWTLVKQGQKGSTWHDFLVSHIKAKSRAQKTLPTLDQDLIQIGCDPTLVNVQEVESLVDQLHPLNAKLVACDVNLVDAIWGHSRPKRTLEKIHVLETKYTGRSPDEKLKELVQRLKAISLSTSASRTPISGVLLSSLDEIAWVLNLRGSDIAFNPVFFSYLWIGLDPQTTEIQSLSLFVHDSQIDQQVRDHLSLSAKVDIKPYDQIWNFLDTIPRGSFLQKSTTTTQEEQVIPKVLICPQTSWAIQTRLGGPSHTLKTRSPIQHMKAIKNPIEIQGFRDCHIRDGAALVSYFAWLEEQLLVHRNTTLTEFQGSVELQNFRAKLSPVGLFKGPSFETISSSAKNAAIIHYSPTKEKSDVIDKDQIYLCDSGGQYLDGTTDVTRTLHFGTPTAEEIRAFTRVLQGHIALATSIFPEKVTTGYHLDILARQYLWKDGLDYRHGTGHGVGHYLNVHEGPQGIGTRIGYNEVGLLRGMVISNEPGFYKDDHFGIRIESMILVTPSTGTSHSNRSATGDGTCDSGTGGKDTGDAVGGDQRHYVGFENLTLCPIQKKLIDWNLLERWMVVWVNEYHRLVLEKLLPLVRDDQRAVDWLRRECEPVV